MDVQIPTIMEIKNIVFLILISFAEYTTMEFEPPIIDIVAPILASAIKY